MFSGQHRAGPTGDELELPSLKAKRNGFSLLLFHKIQCGDVSIEKDMYEGHLESHWHGHLSQ